MSETFILEDLFNILITLEHVGHTVYNDLAERSDDKKIKIIFEDLAHSEKDHEILYSEMKEKYITYESENFDDEYLDYISNLLDSTFTLKENILSSQKSDKEILNLALQLEKETIMFLREIKLILKENDSAINSIIEEEKRHVVKINSMIKKL
ncbi:MAG TPA: ferritin family protein [Victivallales bacterium]|nr:ferritin family protein [Victivallales bacterium]